MLIDLLKEIWSFTREVSLYLLGASSGTFPVWLEIAGGIILILLLSHGLYKEKVKPRWKRS